MISTNFDTYNSHLLISKKKVKSQNEKSFYTQNYKYYGMIYK